MPKSRVVKAALQERIAGLERELATERQVRRVGDGRSSRCLTLLQEAERTDASTVAAARLKAALAGTRKSTRGRRSIRPTIGEDARRRSSVE